jgi:hypothetical protein
MMNITQITLQSLLIQTYAELFKIKMIQLYMKLTNNKIYKKIKNNLK